MNFMSHAIVKLRTYCYIFRKTARMNMKSLTHKRTLPTKFNSIAILGLSNPK